ncbi:ribonuclease H-like domain-containing protein [Tanacetum coccineum]
MTDFLNKSGTIHQTSCAYIPHQNGVAERKHRHLLNVARSLMFQGGIPLCFCPNDDGRDPSGSNTDYKYNSDDTVDEQSFDDDQGSVQIGEENFPEGNVPKNNNVPTYFFDIEESNGLRRFIANINKSFEPKSYKEVALDKNWVQAINDEMHALYENNT